jgi:hypothetical protein
MCPSRTAVYGPVRTVVWQESAGNRRPYADRLPTTNLPGPIPSESLFVANIL